MTKKNEQEDVKKKSHDDESNMTKEQQEAVNTSEKECGTDKMSDAGDANVSKPCKEMKETDEDAPIDIENKYNELNDSYLRLRAEFDNYRKRTLREKADLIKMGGESVLTGLLPVIDDFERALETIQKTGETNPVAEGIELIYNKLMTYLAQQGVKPIEDLGQPFNTELFEAVATIPAPEEAMKGKIVDCVQRGYILYEKVIRHAKVVVGE